LNIFDIKNTRQQSIVGRPDMLNRGMSQIQLIQDQNNPRMLNRQMSTLGRTVQRQQSTVGQFGLNHFYSLPIPNF